MSSSNVSTQGPPVIIRKPHTFNKPPIMHGGVAHPHLSGPAVAAPIVRIPTVVGAPVAEQTIDINTAQTTLEWAGGAAVPKFILPVGLYNGQQHVFWLGNTALSSVQVYIDAIGAKQTLQLFLNVNEEGAGPPKPQWNRNEIHLVYLAGDVGRWEIEWDSYGASMPIITNVYV